MKFKLELDITPEEFSECNMNLLENMLKNGYETTENMFKNEHESTENGTPPPSNNLSKEMHRAFLNNIMIGSQLYPFRNKSNDSTENNSS